MKHLLIVVFSCFLQFGFAQSIATQLDQKIEAIAAASELPGFNVSIVDGDGIHFQKAYGVANIAEQTPLTTAHAQGIASVSKTFIGVALFKAVEQGLLTLDDPINKHLPFEVTNPRYPNTPITIRHLATHTSSIRDRISDYEKVYFLENPLETDAKFSFLEKFLIKKILKNKRRSLHDFLETIFSTKSKNYSKKIFTKYPPGSDYEYSNAATGLAGLIIERLSEMPYEEFIKTHILNPLQMKHAGFDISEVPTSLKTTNYVKDIAIPENINLMNPPGGLLLSNQDLSAYLSEMIRGFEGRGSLLSAESYKAMFAKQLDESKGIKQASDEINQGIFWTYRTSGIIGHTGGGLGASAFFFFDPETSIGKIFMTNCDITTDKKLVAAFFEVWSVMSEMEQGF